MANTFAPNGFSQYQGTGTTPTYEQVTASIAAASTIPIYCGDPVTPAVGTTGLGTGYLVQGYGPVTLTVAATAITTSAAGVLTVSGSVSVTGTYQRLTFANRAVVGSGTVQLPVSAQAYARTPLSFVWSQT